MNGIDTILLDRDGTLIEERHYLRDPDQVALIPGTVAPMRRLAELGCRFFVVSNQSGIGRGLLTEVDYQRVHTRLEELLRAEGLTLAGAAHCPHAPGADCPCRKPRTGLWDQLAGTCGLRPETTVMVGDKAADIRFGQTVGCAETVLVLTGHGRKEADALGLTPSGLAVEACPSGPGRPTWMARDLGSYLDLLVQKRDIVHAHRV